MRRALAVALLALFAAPAALAAAPTNAQLAARIKALETKLAKDEKTIKTLRSDLNDVGGLAVGTLFFSACGFAITADAFQGQFSVTDQISVNTPNVARAFFGPQTPVSDQTACTQLKVVRTQAVPPTTAAFSALLSLIRAPAAISGLSVARR